METLAETGISYAVGDTNAFAADNLGVTFTKHATVNLATGWMGDKYGWSGWGVQQAAETFGDTAVDVLWHEKELTLSLVGINAGSNLVGEGLGKALPVVWKQGGDYVKSLDIQWSPKGLGVGNFELRISPTTLGSNGIPIEVATREGRKALENVQRLAMMWLRRW